MSESKNDKKVRLFFMNVRDDCANIFGELFDEHNKIVCSDCPCAPEKGENNYHSKKRGCCTSCATNNGYFDFSMGASETILRKKYKFTKSYGFFNNQKKECKLPRNMRSSTCLGHSCFDLYKKLKLKGQPTIGVVSIYRESKSVLREPY